MRVRRRAISMVGMCRHTFRFGVVAGMADDGKAWTSLARRTEELGFDTLLMPDTRWTPSPFPALAAAAAGTSSLRLGTHVLAVPFRTPAMVARETDTLDLLSDGRFELGLGTGRPGAESEAAHLGMPWGSAAERLAMLTETIATVKREFAERGVELPPIMLAGSGRWLLDLAAAEADILTLALPPSTDEEGLAAKVGELRSTAGEAVDRLELAINLTAVGGELPPEIAGRLGVDLEGLRRAGSYAVLDGSPREMADTLLRRRDRYGITYVTVGRHMMEPLARVIELLHGT